jgi:hypothetical protein
MQALNCPQPAGVSHGLVQSRFQPGPTIANTASAPHVQPRGAAELNGSYALRIADITKYKCAYTHKSLKNCGLMKKSKLLIALWLTELGV